jgi:hypothetical protein
MRDRHIFLSGGSHSCLPVGCVSRGNRTYSMELTLQSVRLALHFCRVFWRLPLGIPSRSLKADASMNTEKSEPKPCKRFAKRFVWNARFLAHLPCEECEAMIAYLVSESNKLMRQRREANRAARNRPN